MKNLYSIFAKHKLKYSIYIVALILVLISIVYIPKTQQKYTKNKGTGVKILDKTTTTEKNINSNSTGMTKDELSSTMKNLKKQSIGVGPWIIVYGDENKILFYNYSHLLAYSNKDDCKGIYNAIDLKKLDVGEYQGSSVTCFNPSPNGKYCIIGNSNNTSSDINYENMRL